MISNTYILQPCKIQPVKSRIYKIICTFLWNSFAIINIFLQQL